MRILFVAPRMIGDAVMSSGVLDHLIRADPDARVTVVAAPEAAGLFAAMPGLGRLILLRKRSLHRHWFGLWVETVGTRWDVAIDLRGSGLPYALRARRRFIRKPMPGVRIYRQHAALLGLDPAPVPVVWTAAADRARAEVLVPAGTPVVALCPTASWDPKMWPAERFAALFRSLRAHDLPGARAAVFAGPGERERARAAPLLALLPDAIDLCGRTTLAESAACLARCALAVCNDSGLMHLAAATGVPTLGLRAHFVDRAAPFEPAGRAAAWVLRAGDDMTAIPVADALAGCRDVLSLGRAGSGGRDVTEHLVKWDDLLIVDAPGGVTKRRLAIGDATLVTVAVPAGTAAGKHSHPHGQFVQVVSGTGTLTTEQGEKPFGPGSVFVFPGDTWHAARFETDTVLIESNLPV